MSSKKPRSSSAGVTAVAAVAAIALGLAACGGGALPTVPSTRLSTEDDSTQTTVLSETLAGVQAGTERVLRFSLPRSGNLAVTVEWSDPDNSVVAVLTGAGCFAFHNPDADCQVRRSSRREASEGKEGRQEFIDYPGAEGSFLLTVQNLGPGADSIRVTAVLSATPATPDPTPPTPRPTERPDRGAPNPPRER
jgi:hypothetical protein